MVLSSQHEEPTTASLLRSEIIVSYKKLIPADCFAFIFSCAEQKIDASSLSDLPRTSWLRYCFSKLGLCATPFSLITEQINDLIADGNAHQFHTSVIHTVKTFHGSELSMSCSTTRVGTTPAAKLKLFECYNCSLQSHTKNTRNTIKRVGQSALGAKVWAQNALLYKQHKNEQRGSATGYSQVRTCT